MEETTNLLIRRALYKDMFLIAEHHTSLAKQAGNAGNNEEELRHSLVAIIMACCSLEAFINTYTMERHWKEWGTKEGRTIERKGIKEKWVDTTRECNIEETTFDKQSQPYMDFSKLLVLRNSLVHYKVKPTQPIKSMRGLISEQETELTASKAVWAIKTAKLMMRDFCTFTKKPLPKYLE